MDEHDIDTVGIIARGLASKFGSRAYDIAAEQAQAANDDSLGKWQAVAAALWIAA